MPSLVVPGNNMANKRAGNQKPAPKPKANQKRPAPASKATAAAKKAPRTSVSASSVTEPAQGNLKDPPPPTTTSANVASVAASATTNTTASAATQRLPTSVNIRGTDGGSDHGTVNDALTQATAATTAAYSGPDSGAADLNQMEFTIRNYVTQHFFPSVKFITKKEKLAYYAPGTNPTSYCARIIRGCHLPPDLDPAQWWETVAKRTVKRKIAQLRSDKINALKKAYFGKWWAWVRFQFLC
jgi:hypothetical protein